MPESGFRLKSNAGLRHYPSFAKCILPKKIVQEMLLKAAFLCDDTNFFVVYTKKLYWKRRGRLGPDWQTNIQRAFHLNVLTDRRRNDPERGFRAQQGPVGADYRSLIHQFWVFRQPSRALSAHSRAAARKKCP
jgi:hypothetical protein